jgi:hypothetical protein
MVKLWFFTIFSKIKRYGRRGGEGRGRNLKSEI